MGVFYVLLPWLWLFFKGSNLTEIELEKLVEDYEEEDDTDRENKKQVEHSRDWSDWSGKWASVPWSDRRWES